MESDILHVGSVFQGSVLFQLRSNFRHGPVKRSKNGLSRESPASLTKETITFLFIGLIFILIHLHICIYTYTYLNVYYIFTLGTGVQYNTESLYVDILLAARRMASSASKKLAHGSLSLLLSILLMRCRQRFSDGQMLSSFNQPVYL